MPSQKMSRRQALKAIAAAAGGLTAAAFIPAKWLKPVVDAGLLPVHASTSACHVIDPEGIQFSYGSGDGDDGTGTTLQINYAILAPPVPQDTPYTWAAVGVGTGLTGTTSGSGKIITGSQAGLGDTVLNYTSTGQIIITITVPGYGCWTITKGVIHNN